MSCRVSIPLTVLEDPAFLPLRDAFHPERMQGHLRGILLDCGHKTGGCSCSSPSLESIRVFRHKPAKRCLVEYTLAGADLAGSRAGIGLIGKIRAKGPDHRSFSLLRKLWAGGFDLRAVDGIVIPEPICLVTSLNLLLQRKVAGDSLEMLLRVPRALTIAHRVAEAAAKLHRFDLVPNRRHTMVDELSILRDRFDRLLATTPTPGNRLNAIFQACGRLLSGFDEASPRCIHRDFYPAQLLLSGPALHLLDFDLCCSGDPALDIGNFLGHITEQSIREHGHPGAYSCFELMVKERYLEFAGVEHRARIRAYQTLTVARHLYLCTLKPERLSGFPLLLDWCEERLDLRSNKPSGVMPVRVEPTQNPSTTVFIHPYPVAARLK